MSKPKKATQRLQFTEGRLAGLKKPEQAEKIYDKTVQHLGLKLLPNGRRVYFWWRTVKGKPTWRTIGDSPDIQLGAARAKAQEFDVTLATWKMNAYAGPNPFEVQSRTSVPLFRELVEAYIAGQIRTESLNPVRAEYAIRQAVAKRFGSWLDRPIDTIGVEDVLAVKRKCAGKYAQRAYVQFLSTLFNWSAGKLDGKINFWKLANVAEDISVPEKEKRKRFLQPEELLSFFEGLEKEKHRDFRDVLVLLLATGARKGNVFEMRWQDVSIELKNWHVPMSKSGESYEIDLLPAALKVLERRRGVFDAEETFVFPSRSKSGHIEDVKKQWVRFRAQCGFPGVRLHDLRRTKFSYQASGGVSLQIIGAGAGHKSLGSTEIYARLLKATTTTAAETGDAMMRKMMRQAQKRIGKPALLTA